MKLKHGWLFDVDGVIASPHEKQVTNPHVINLIAERLLKGEPASLITGRSIDWLKERILHHFEFRKNIDLSKFFVSAEKGGVFGSYGSKKELNLTTDNNLQVPEEAKQEIEELVEKFPEIIFFDSPKKTMVSIEVIDGVDIAKFKEIQPRLDQLILEILKKHNLQTKFRVDSVRLSTDIESIEAGKNLAARRFLNFLKDLNIELEKFYAFGDSISDIQMAQELFDNGQDVTFIFVGGREMLKEKYPFEIVYPQKLFDDGVVEFMSANND